MTQKEFDHLQSHTSISFQYIETRLINAKENKFDQNIYNNLLLIKALLNKAIDNENELKNKQ